MKANFYKIECLTNLHVGSGEINYNIIDNEVQKDPVTGNPSIYASSLKGALRHYFENEKPEEIKVERVFGSAPKKAEKSEKGKYKFFDARILARPLRASSGPNPYVLVTTVEQILGYCKDLKDFDFEKEIPELLCKKIDELKEKLENKENPLFYVIKETIDRDLCTIEGEKTGISCLEAEHKAFLEALLGETFAITTDAILQCFDLPVIARNHLEEGLSKNLWYEEIVPHKSCFYFMVLRPEDNNELSFNRWVQLGGNATIGCGYTNITKLQ